MSPSRRQVVAASLCRGVQLALLFLAARRHSAVATTERARFRLIPRVTMNTKPVMPGDNGTKWPRRPPRLGRLFGTLRPFYFITFNTYQRLGLLARDEIHDTFCAFLPRQRSTMSPLGAMSSCPITCISSRRFQWTGLPYPVGFNRCAT